MTGKKWMAGLLSLAMLVSGNGLTGMTAQAAGKASVKLNKTSVSIAVKKSAKLKVVKKNVKKVKSQKWSSGNKKIASVTQKGKVTAKKAGTATITCKVKYVEKKSGKTAKKTLKCRVKVTAAKAQVTASAAVPSTGAAVVPTTNVQPTPTGAQPAPTGIQPAPTDAQMTIPPQDTPTPIPTEDGSLLVEGAITPDEIEFRMEYDDTSNIGEEREVIIAGAVTGGSMMVRDNGSIRKELTSQELADTKMGLGINLGNTMEAIAPMDERETAEDPAVFETAWGQPVTTQEYIDCLHSYGINTLRIPVAWSNMDSEDGTYTINEKYLARVEQIANYALNNGMYVIINDHWDNQWWGAFGASKKDEDGNSVPDEERRAGAWKRYESYWTQISERFKDYSDHLILEGGNEELGTRLNDPIYSNGYASTTDENDKMTSGIIKKSELYDMVNKINQKFVDVVRKSGGNNQYRFLLIPGYDTNIESTSSKKFIMPADLEENGTAKLLVSVHYYTPWAFCGDNNTGDYRVRDRRAHAKNLKPLQRFVDEGYGIVMGECGVCSPKTVKGSTSKWLYDTFLECTKYHMVPVMWEIGQFFDRANAKLRYHDLAVLFNTLTDSQGDTSMKAETGPALAEPEIVEIGDRSPAWSWTGKWYKNGGNNMVGDDRFEEGGGTKVLEGGVDKFVPENVATPTISGDETTLEFNEWGFQAFLKLDLSKYKKPAIAFSFLEGTDNEELVGIFKGGASETAEYHDDVTLEYEKFHGKAVVLDESFALSAEKPYLSITFGAEPIVTGIAIYELGE